MREQPMKALSHLTQPVLRRVAVLIDDFDNLAYGLPQFAIFVVGYALQSPLIFRHRAYTVPYVQFRHCHSDRAYSTTMATMSGSRINNNGLLFIPQHAFTSLAGQSGSHSTGSVA